jgi:hypothetical protein
MNDKYDVENLKLCESLIKTSDFNNLFDAMHECKHDVGWKQSVQGFVKNGCINCYELSQQIMNLNYQIGPYRCYQIFEPKSRQIVAMYMKDRVVQRSFSDNYFYSIITKSFIYDNFACQKGKGTLRARNRYKAHLQKHFRKFGINGYALKLDIHAYFSSIPHDIVINNMKSKLDNYGVYMVNSIIDKYWTSKDSCSGHKIGIFLGSIITQLIGVSILDELDHIIKEKFHMKHYVRYNDDMIILSEDKSKLIDLLEFIKSYLSNINLKLNMNKSRIYNISEKIEFLGFDFRLTNTGYVVITVPKHKLKYKKHKLKNMVRAAASGKISKDVVDQHFESYLTHISYGNTYKLSYDLRNYYNKLWKDVYKYV